jgi:hypothetical protein
MTGEQSDIFNSSEEHNCRPILRSII